MKKRILLIFLDGVGLGDDDPAVNPFAIIEAPTLHALANGQRWLRSTGFQRSQRAVFVPTDPNLGVSGRPLSASGQAAILTGRNVPQIIGQHYGPKPNPPIRDLLAEGSFFQQVMDHGGQAALVEGYPPPWHDAIASGKMLPSSYQQAALNAGLRFFDVDDLRAGRAISGDWTGEGWRTQLGYADMPVLSPEEAGRRLVEISRAYDFAFMAHWLTDMIGHRGTIEEAVALLETFDRVMAGVLQHWDDAEGLVIVTSDHGNIEQIGSRRHTTNPVPTLVIGDSAAAFAEDLTDLTGLVPRMGRFLFG
jgi:hypothetical protein